MGSFMAAQAVSVVKRPAHRVDETPARNERAGRSCGPRPMKPNASSNDKSSDTECPTCGRDDFSRRQDMTTHHKSQHGGSIAGVGLVCEQCGSEYRVPHGRVEESKFCSRSCASKSRTSKNHPQWKGRETKNICEWCGKEYTPRKYRENVSKYCSWECYIEGDDRTEGDNSNWNGGKTTYECEWCGEEFKEWPGQTHRFCSHECRLDGLNENNERENNPNWKGGWVPYGEGWNATKKKHIRERDGYECQLCGMGEKTHIEQFGRKHAVHHIVPARQFTDAGSRNAPPNLITLCDSCHKIIEQMAPLLPDGVR